MRPFKVTAIRHPAELPWGHVDVIMECAGVFTAKDEAQAHLSTGAKRAQISALGDDADKTIVYGVNHGTLTKDDLVVSSQRVLHHQLPVAKVLNGSIGTVRGFMTTIQNYTGDQPTLDTMHKGLYRRVGNAIHLSGASGGKRAS